MLSRKLLQRLSVAVAFATLSSFSIFGVGSAQVAALPVVRIDSPTSSTSVNGTATFTGVAVDCATGTPATRVAVTDNAADGPYLADVSMDTVRPLAAACANRTGSAQFGFTLIMDTRRLADGRHTLFFRATYPGGATATASTDIWVNNASVYGNPCGYSYSAYCGSGYYSGGVSYTGGYTGGYGGGYIGGYTGGYTGSYTSGYTGGGYSSCIAYNSIGFCQMWTNAPGSTYPGSIYPNGAYLNNYNGSCGYYANGLCGPVISNPQRIAQPCVGAPWRTCVYSVGGFTVQR